MFGKRAEVKPPVLFVASNSAHGHFQPDFTSAISMTPPFGCSLVVKRQSSDWVLARAFSKDAWFNLAYLSDVEPVERVSVAPPFDGYGWQSRGSGAGSTLSNRRVEYGPRGGRYTRTKSGQRRYF